MCVMFYCKLHKHNCTVTPAHLCITSISGAGLMHCVGPSACIVWQCGNSARKGQVSTRFLGYPQYFEMNTTTLHISPILRRHNMGTWFSVVTTTIGNKWVYNVGSPSIILQHYRHTTRMTGEERGAYSIFPCWQACGSVENCAPFCSVPEYLPPITVNRRRHSAATSLCFVYDLRADAITTVIWQLSARVLAVGLIGLS